MNNGSPYSYNETLHAHAEPRVAPWLFALDLVAWAVVTYVDRRPPRSSVGERATRRIFLCHYMWIGLCGGRSVV